MSLEHGACESRRSTRVQLTVRIEAKGLTEPLTCEGETIVVNLDGARMSTSVPVRVGTRIEIYVILTDKRKRTPQNASGRLDKRVIASQARDVDINDSVHVER